MKYDNVLAQTSPEHLVSYIGAEAPDLSMMIRSKGCLYLSTFINDPQKVLESAAMPRVGLTQQSQNKLIAYMEKIGDRKKVERDDLGYKLISFMVLFTLLAYLWKVKIWGVMKKTRG